MTLMALIALAPGCPLLGNTGVPARALGTLRQQRCLPDIRLIQHPALEASDPCRGDGLSPAGVQVPVASTHLGLWQKGGKC